LDDSLQPAEAGRAGGSAVRLRGVSIEFPIAGGRYVAVDKTDLAIGAHEFVAIVGPTGCGKSTLLNASAGLLTPSTGEVLVFGARLDGPQQGGGLPVPARTPSCPWKTAVDNVAIGLEVAGVARSEALERAQTWLKRVGPGGLRRPLSPPALGRPEEARRSRQVLIRDPKILLMDEPFGPLDAQTRQIMGNLLLDLWAGDRKAVLFVTHDLEEAIALADRVVIMSAGPQARIIGDHAIDPRPARAMPRKCACSRASTSCTRRSGASCAPKS
jgi:NitT/TauT family transport system ATP-binding protein